MAIDIIIRTDTYRELVDVLRRVSYADIPCCPEIYVAITKDIQTILDTLVRNNEPNVKLTEIMKDVEYSEEVKEYIASLWDDIREYGLDISVVKILDNYGSILLNIRGK